MSAKQLREERAPLAKTIRDLADKINAEKRDFSAEEQEAWKKVNDDYNALSRRIDITEAAERVEADQSRIITDPRLGRGAVSPPAADGSEMAITQTHRTLALQAWCGAKTARGPSPKQLDACRVTGFNPYADAIEFNLFDTGDAQDLQRRYAGFHPSVAQDRVSDFKAALSSQSGPAGAFTIVPETLLRSLEINLLAYGYMRQVAEIIRTETGERISWPTVDDTTNKGKRLQENTAVGTTTDPTFGKVFWDAYDYTSDAVLVPYRLLQDTVFDLPRVLGQLLGTRLARKANTDETIGPGMNGPKGIVIAATAFNAASATAITFDDILGLIHSIDPAYRLPGCGFMLHDQILLVIRKLKDGVGRYLWESNIQTGMPDRLSGYPLTLNQDMDSTVATTKKTILFGMLSNYKIRTVGQVRMYRLQERYRDSDQDGFLAFMREDGNLLTAGTAPVKVLTQP